MGLGLIGGAPGNVVDDVSPATYISPERSIAIAFAFVSPSLPFRYVEKTQMPGSKILVTNALMDEAVDSFF